VGQTHPDLIFVVLVKDLKIENRIKGNCNTIDVVELVRTDLGRLEADGGDVGLVCTSSQTPWSMNGASFN